MLFRQTSKPNSTINTHRIRYSDVDHSTPFSQLNQNEVLDICTIKKARKIMQSKQQSLLNRIKVIKKEEQKAMKRKENQFKLFVKLQTAKRDHSHYLSANKTPRKLSTKQNIFRTRQNSVFATKRNHHQSLKSLHQQNQTDKFKGQKMFLEKIQNAKRLKEEKAKNEVKITKQRTIQLNRKLQSAGMIRRNRQKIKETRQNFYRSRQQSIKHFKEQKIEKERLKYVEIEKHIKDLQREEFEALSNWKKVMQEEEYDFCGLKGIQINEARGWLLE